MWLHFFNVESCRVEVFRVFENFLNGEGSRPKRLCAPLFRRAPFSSPFFCQSPPLSRSLPSPSSTVSLEALIFFGGSRAQRRRKKKKKKNAFSFSKVL